MTDVYTGWTECRAVWGKGSHGVLEALKDIEASLPFPILSFNSDNGSEFLNHTIFRYFSPGGEKPRPGFLMTRSREYRKNDNCHVEQKNWTHVRELFGYDRFNDQSKVALMNSIYKKEHSDLQNLFFNQMKLKSKTRVASRYRRIYDNPKTPLQRLVDCELVPKETKTSLTEKASSMNPFRLQKELQTKLKEFFKKETPFSEDQEAA